MNDSGFVLMHRSLLGHPAFRDDGEAMAFMWMIAKASWRPTRVRYKGRPVDLARGELCVSHRDMANALGRDRSWVERLWKRLKSETMIETRVETAATVINIRNYDVYQAIAGFDETPAETPRKTRRETGARQARDTEQQGNQGNKEQDGSYEPSPRKRAERLPEGWTPERLDRSTAAGEIVQRRGAEWARVTFETFDNYWRAKSGKDATKLDWQATWKNWVIAQDKRDGNGTARNGSHPRNGGSGNGFIDAINEAKASDWGSKNPH